jgi:hypothetical protein
MNPAYALFTAGYNNGRYVSIPAKVATAVSSDVDDSSRIDFRIKFKMSSTIWGGLYTAAGGVSELKIQSATALYYRIGNGFNEAITLSSPITTNTIHELHFRRYKSATEGTVVEVELDGVIVGRQINRSVVKAGLENAPTRLGPFQTGTEVYECTLQGFQYINTTDNLQTTWGDGTLVNYPAGSSKWILYDNTYPSGSTSYTLTADTATDSHAASDVTLTYSPGATAYSITCGAVSDAHTVGSALFNRGYYLAANNVTDNHTANSVTLTYTTPAVTAYSITCNAVTDAHTVGSDAHSAENVILRYLPPSDPIDYGMSGFGNNPYWRNSIFFRGR